jgi:peptidoglycan/xylan/chitin deacetylase (PgdA/CDA1 family)
MGTVVISLDAELAWGFHDKPLPEDRLRETRESWIQLRRLFDAYEIPATWAITGHLFLESCEHCHRKHPAGERCCTNAAGSLPADDIWYGNGLVDEIAAASVEHEIAGHGFTHVHFDHECMDDELAMREVERCRNAAADRGFDLSSFVYPVNRIARRDLLAEHDFSCYRGMNPAIASQHTLTQQATKLSSSVIGKPTPPIVEPAVDEHGLVNIPASLYLFNIDGNYKKPFSVIGEDPVVRQVDFGLDQVAETDGVLHLWLHPHNLQTGHHYDRLHEVARMVDRYRKRDGVDVKTMAEVAADTKRAERAATELS